MTEIDEDILKKRRQKVLELLCISKPSLSLCVDSLDNTPALQEWVCNNLKPEIDFATGISIIDAAWYIAESQIENGMEKLKEDN